MARLNVTACYCAAYAGSYLYVATNVGVWRYHTVNNVWEKLPPSSCSPERRRRDDHKFSCLCSVSDYMYAISESNLPMQRYSLAQNIWQSGSKLPFLSKSDEQDSMLKNVSAVVMRSKIYVLHGYCKQEGAEWEWKARAAVFHCFDPQKNEWKQMASTVYPHFESSLFVVDDNKLYVAGGKISVKELERQIIPEGDPAPVEVYDGVYNRWSVVRQKHIPRNNLGAVELQDGRVYFIINKFPVDSGIRIPPGEVYHISLREWEHLGQLKCMAVRKDGGIAHPVLCYLPLRKDSLKTPTRKEKSTLMKTWKRSEQFSMYSVFYDLLCDFWSVSVFCSARERINMSTPIDICKPISVCSYRALHIRCRYMFFKNLQVL